MTAVLYESKIVECVSSNENNPTTDLNVEINEHLFRMLLELKSYTIIFLNNLSLTNVIDILTVTQRNRGLKSGVAFRKGSKYG